MEENKHFIKGTQTVEIRLCNLISSFQAQCKVDFPQYSFSFYFILFWFLHSYLLFQFLLLNDDILRCQKGDNVRNFIGFDDLAEERLDSSAVGGKIMSDIAESYTEAVRDSGWSSSSLFPTGNKLNIHHWWGWAACLGNQWLLTAFKWFGIISVHNPLCALTSEVTISEKCGILCLLPNANFIENSL